MTRKRTLTLLLSLAAVLTRSAYFIVTPLWLDYLDSNNSTRDHNSSSRDHHNDLDTHQISVCFLIVFQWGFCTLCSGLLLLISMIFRPHSIGDVERAFPKKQFVIMGFAMGISTTLFNYSVSGTRTPPYLNGIVVNCNIPIQFITR